MTQPDRFRMVSLLSNTTVALTLLLGTAHSVSAQPGDSSDPAVERFEDNVSNTSPQPTTNNLPKIPQVFSQRGPKNLKDLEELESWVRKLTDELSEYTVGVRIGSSQGSGVIISSDGYVLTAAHVIGQSGRPVTIILPNGQEVRATTLGVMKNNDAGLIKIDEGTQWPYARIAPANSVKMGNWCIALGHPNGFVKGREPVLRLGRVVSAKEVIHTDCTLVGGDSGGPLFDMYGRVIGIHSRIGKQSSQNYHVPIGEYLDNWEELIKN